VRQRDERETGRRTGIWRHLWLATAWRRSRSPSRPQPRPAPPRRSTQDEPAFCGLASLAMVLNALSIDPRRTWKGSWRWFHEKLLDCCLPLDRVASEGIVLSQVRRWSSGRGLARADGC
jgi:hypothetical protein